jgi:hypothetical protein
MAPLRAIVERARRFSFLIFFLLISDLPRKALEMSRFRLPLDPPELGEKIITKMTRLKLDLIKIEDEDGETSITGDYEIHGCLEMEDDGQFIAALIAAFGKEEAEGGACHE